jgi:membrane associated rhomboid family serine protease
VSQMDETPAPRERLFNAPWPSMAVVLLILGSYVVQSSWLGERAAELAFAPADLDQGRWWSTATVTLVHGGWFHAIMNALGALAFGPPVARLLGTGGRGALAFFGFYAVCAVLSSLAYAAFHLHGQEPVVGASGAVSGLMGAAARLIGRPHGLAPLKSRPVVSLGLAWVVTNAIMAVSAPMIPVFGGAGIAWEAHIGGFVAGLLLIGPLAAAVTGQSSR